MITLPFYPFCPYQPSAFLLVFSLGSCLCLLVCFVAPLHEHGQAIIYFNKGCLPEAAIQDYDLCNQ